MLFSSAEKKKARKPWGSVRQLLIRNLYIGGSVLHKDNLGNPE